MEVTSTPLLAIQTVLAIQKIQKAVWILDFDGFSIFGLVPRRSVFGIRKRAAWILDLGIWIFHDFSRALGFCMGYLQVTPIWAGG